MFYKKVVMSLLLLSLAGASLAVDVNCPSAKVKIVQVQNHNVLVLQEGQVWRVVGRYTEPSLDSKLSALLSAQATGRKVQLRYPEGYDCSKTDYGTSTVSVRLYE